MTTYTLTVSTSTIGLGVLSGARVTVERKRTVVSDLFGGQALSKNTASTNASGIATILLEPDDGTVYHEVKVFDLSGVLAYSKIITMPPENISIASLPVQDIISESAARAEVAADAAEAEKDATQAIKDAVDTAVAEAEVSATAAAASEDAAQNARIEAETAKTESQSYAAAALVSETAAALSETNAAASESAANGHAIDAENHAISARDAASLSRGNWPTTAAALGNGVAGTTGLVGGSGGTNGTFALAFSGGTQVIAPVGYFVVSGGAVTQVVITYAGYYSSGTPTISFAASSGLTGASVTAVMAINVPAGSYFTVPASSPNLLTLYRNVAGVATSVGNYPNANAIPLATYYSQRHLVVQRNISGVLNLLIPSATIERAGTFVAINAPTGNRYTEQPLSTSTIQRRHFVDPATGTLSIVDGTTSPLPSYTSELLATSVNGVVSSGKYRVIGDMNTVPNLFPYGKDATEVTKTSGGQLVTISDSNLTALGFSYGWGNVSGNAFHGLDFDDAVESPYYFVRVYQQHDGTVVLPTVTITYTDRTNLQFNPSIEQTLSANTCSHSGFGRAAIGKKVASIIVGGTSMGTRDIRFCGVQIYSGQEPAVWIDRLDYPTLLPMSTRIKQIEDAIFTLPSLSSSPVITGTRTVGSTLTCSTGSWSSIPSVSRYRYQWLRNGAAISGATATTYVLQVADANTAVTCRVKATNAKGSRVCIANPVGIGTVYVLHLLGQSNMIGWGQGGSIDRSIDLTPYNAREYMQPLGENQFPDPLFEQGLGSWASSNATLAVASNRLTATVTVAAYANMNFIISGLVANQKYRFSAKVSGAINVTVRLSSPQTQVYHTGTTNGTYIDFEFTPSSTTATFYLITTSVPSIGNTFGIEDTQLRPVLASGNGDSIVSSDPLTWPLASQSASWGVCPASQAARDLLTAGASMVVLNPLAVGGTGLYNSVWAVGGTYQTNAVTQITKAVADYPVAGATHVLVWLQGEQDALNSVSQANYQSALTATLNSFRAITGLTNARIVVLEMMQEFQALNAGAAAIDAAHQATVAAISNAVYVATPSGYAQPDNIHFNAAGSRAIGALIASNV